MTNKFAPKLTFALRCFIYASHWHKSVPYPTLARAFNVNMETVGLICRNSSRSYANVRAEANRMGADLMYKHYSTLDLEARVEKARYNEPDFPIDREITGTGPGKYWLKNRSQDIVEVDIMPYGLIKDQTDPVAPEFQRGFYYKDPELGWTFDEEPFFSVEEALRYLAEFPPRWEK